VFGPPFTHRSPTERNTYLGPYESIHYHIIHVQFLKNMCEIPLSSKHKSSTIFWLHTILSPLSPSSLFQLLILFYVLSFSFFFWSRSRVNSLSLSTLYTLNSYIHSIYYYVLIYLYNPLGFYYIKRGNIGLSGNFGC